MPDAELYPPFAAALDRITAGQAPARIVLALSGGLDSVVLARLTAAWLSGKTLPCLAAHVHHGLRADDADADCAFSRALADQLGMVFRVLHADARATAREEGVGIEEAGRRIRYRFFRDLAGTDGLVLTGHHADDQVETILLNARRGAHARGFAGMNEAGTVGVPPDVTVRVGRPLLAFRKIALCRHAENENWEWREDATNQDSRFSRNRLRVRTIPLLEQWLPGFSERLLARAREARAHEETFSAQAEAILTAWRRHEDNGTFLDAAGMTEAGQETALYVLRHIAEEATGGRIRGRDVLLRLHSLVRAGRLGETVALCSGVYARRERDGLFFFRGERGGHETGELLLPDPPFSLEAFGARVQAEWIEAGRAMPPEDMRDQTIQWLRPDAIRGRLRLRSPFPGERFHPMGASGSRKIQDMLVDLKTPRREKTFPRVIADDEGGLWIWPYRLAERARLHETKGPALRMRITRPSVP